MAALTQGKNRSMSPFSDAKQSALDESGAIKGLICTRSRATAGCSGGQRQAGLLLTRCSTKPVCTVRTAPGKQHEPLDVIKSGRLEKRVVRHVKGRSIAVCIHSAKAHGEGLQGWRGRGREGGREGWMGWMDGGRENTRTHGLRTRTHICTHEISRARALHVLYVCVHAQQRLDAYPITSLPFCPLLRKCAGVGAALRTAVKDEVEFLR